MSFDEKAVLELYHKGYSDYKIGNELGIDRWKVGRIRKKYDLPANFKWGGNEKKIYSEDEKKLIFELHAKGVPIGDIAQEIGVNSRTLSKFCDKEGLDTSIERGKSYRGHLKNELVFEYLEKNGPTSIKTLSEKLKIQRTRFAEFLRVFYDEIEAIEFKVGTGRGGIKHGGYELYGDFCRAKSGKILLLRNDPRLIDFAASKIQFKINNYRDAATLAKHLSRVLGKERSSLIIEKLGYKYSRDLKNTPNQRTKKFTDDQFLNYYNKGLNDVEISKILVVTPSSIGARRRRLGLQPIRSLHKERNIKENVQE